MSRGEVFRYESYAVDAEAGLLTCRYSLDSRRFEERLNAVTRRLLGGALSGRGRPAGVLAGGRVLLQDGGPARHRPVW